MGSKVDTFVSYFPQILSSGGSVKENLEKKLENPTVRAAFKEFACTHSDLVHKSPLLHRAAYHADSLQSNTFANLFLRINELYTGNFAADIRLIEDILFQRVIRPSDFAITPSQLQHVMSLHEAGLIGSQHLVEFFSKKDPQGFTLLDYAGHFSTVQPWLRKLASNYPKALIQLLSIQNELGNTPLHHWRVLEAAQGWLTLLAKTPIVNDKRNLFVDILSITNKSGNTPLAHETIFNKAQSWLHSLVQLENLVEGLLIRGKSGRTPLHTQPNFISALRLFETLAEHHPEQFVKLLSAQDSKGQTPLHCAQNLMSIQPLLVTLAKTQPQLFTSLLSIRDHYGMTPFDRLDFLNEALPEFAEILLDRSSLNDEIFTGGYLSENEMETLFTLNEEIAKSPELSETRLRWLHSLVKDHPGLLIKALSLCNDASHSVLDNPKNFNGLMPLLTELAETNPELFLTVTSTRGQNSKKYTDHRTHSLFEQTDYLQMAIPLLLILNEKGSFNALKIVLPATVASAFEKLSQIVPPQKEFVKLFRDLLFVPLETAAMKEITGCFRNIPLDYQGLEIAKTLSATNLENTHSAFEVYKRQLAWQQDICATVFPQTRIGSSRASISSAGLIKASETTRITRDMIPPAATLENWNLLRESLRACIEKMPKARNCYKDFDDIWTECLNHPFFEDCLNFENAEEIPLYKAYWACILNWILSHDDTPPNASTNTLTPRQEKLYLAAQSYVYCDTGKQENLEKQYSHLPPEFKLSIAISQNAAQTRARFAMVIFLREYINALIQSHEVLNDLTDGGGLKQEVHNSLYIKHTIGPLLGLGTISYDLLAHEISPSLLKMGRDELLERFLNHFTPLKLVDKFISATENEPLVKRSGEETFNDQVRSLITTSQAFWEYDEDELTAHLNKRGALELLRILGVVKTTEPPVLFDCASPFAAMLNSPTEDSQEKFTWTQNEGIAFQCKKIKETIPRLVADKGTHGKMQSLQTWIRHSDALKLQIRDDWIRNDRNLRESILSHWTECSTQLQIAILASWNRWDDEVKENLRTQWKKCAPEIREEILTTWKMNSETSLDELLSRWEAANEVQRTQAIQFLDQKENLQAKWKTCALDIREKVLTAWEIKTDSSPEDFIAQWDTATEQQKSLVIQLLDLTIFDLQQPLMARWESCSPMVKREIINLIPEQYNAQFTQEWNSIFASIAEHYKEPIVHFVEDLFIPNHPLSLVTFLEQKPHIIELLVPSNHLLLKKEIGTTLTDLVGKCMKTLLESSSEPYVLEAARHLRDAATS